MEQMTMLDEMVVLSTLRRSRLTSEAAAREEAAAVQMARAAGWSWARVARELGLHHEYLRRHYSARRSG